MRSRLPGADRSGGGGQAATSSSGIGDFLEAGVGKYVFSFLVGLALSTLFFEICEGTECVAFRGPTIEQVDGAVYRYEGAGGGSAQCMQNTLVPVECDVSKRILPFSDKIADAHQTRNHTFPATIRNAKENEKEKEKNENKKSDDTDSDIDRREGENRLLHRL